MKSKLLLTAAFASICSLSHFPFTAKAQEATFQTTIDFDVLIENLARLEILRCEVSDEVGYFLFERKESGRAPLSNFAGGNGTATPRNGGMTYVSDDIVW